MPFGSLYAADDHGKQAGHEKNAETDNQADDNVNTLFGEACQYFEEGNIEQGDSICEIALQEAELSFRSEIILQAINKYLELNKLGANLEVRLSYASRAEELVSQVQDEELRWETYTNLAALHLEVFDIDKSLAFGYKSLSAAESLGEKRHKAISYLSIGHALQAGNQKIEAFRYLLNALTLSESLGDEELRLDAYEALSRFYNLSGLFQKALEYKVKQIDLLMEAQPVDSVAIMWANCDLIQITVFGDNKLHEPLLEDIFGFALIHHNYGLKQYALALYRSYLMNNNEFEELRNLYVGRFPEELESLQESQTALYHKLKAIFAELDHEIEAANHHYQLAEAIEKENSNMVMVSNFFLRYGEFLERHGLTEEAIGKYQEAYAWAHKASYLDFALRSSNALARLYSETGSFEDAFNYSQLGRVIVDSIKSINRRDELLALEIQNTERIQELSYEQELLEKKRRHNIQYTAIIIIIFAVFIILIMLGSFKVSASLIHFLGFVSFILLFEFIILLADNYIHHATHGEPVYILAIKIVLIGFLLPFHHWIERKVTHHLINKRLISVEKLSPSRVIDKVLQALREIWSHGGGSGNHTDGH